MSEAAERLRCAWYVLRGWSVVRGVSITGGEITVHRHNMILSGKSIIAYSSMSVPKPVAIRGNSPDAYNEGNALRSE